MFAILSGWQYHIGRPGSTTNLYRRQSTPSTTHLCGKKLK